MSSRIARTLPVLLTVLLAVPAAHACEVCAVYTFLDAKEAPAGWYAGVFAQSQELDQLLDHGEEVENEAGESIRSLTTQVYVGYQFSRRLGVQVNVPYISRKFDRVVEEEEHARSSAAEHGEPVMESGTESGLGDVALLLHFRALERHTGSGSTIWSLYGGLELPTGDSDRLAEAHHHGEAESTSPHRLAHGSVESAIGGHDLALGSGSTDGIVGSNLFWSHGRVKVEATAQYALRQEGDHDYRIGDELTWSVKPGYFVALSHAHTFGVGAHLSGEDKSEDEHEGETLAGTDLDALFAGPTLFFSFGERWSGELAVDFPIDQDSSGLLLVADQRVRLGMTARF